MFFTVISWIYITFLTYCIGSSFHRLLSLFAGGNMGSWSVHFSLTCISGLLVTGVISGVLCLIIPLGFISNLVMLLLAVLSCLLNGRRLWQSVKRDWPLFENRFLFIVFCLYVIAVAYFSYVPSTHHDDGLYYSTSIKWLQEFGSVKGLSNVNARIGFNSAWHILQANFGFQFLHAGLFNDLNGLFYLYMLIFFLKGVDDLFKKDYSLPNILRGLFFLSLLALYTGGGSNVLIYNVNQLSSPSPDLPVCMLTWLIFLLFIGERETVGKVIHVEELLVIFYCIFLITMKLSAIPLLLLPAFILLRMIYRGGAGKAAMIMASALIMLTPWVIRNIIVSGYLFYPLSELDVLSVDWKIPIENVRYHENVVKVFAIDAGMDLSKPFTIPLKSWLPGWFGRLEFIKKASFCAAILITAVLSCIAVAQLVRRQYSFFHKNIHYGVFCLTSVVGILFWLNKGPDFRFGYGFIGIYCSFALALLIKSSLKSNKRFIAPVVTVLSYAALFNYANEFKYMVRDLFKSPIALPQPIEIMSVPINHGQIMHVVTHDDCWNGPLPIATNSEFYYIQPLLRGNTIKEGFKAGVSAHQAGGRGE